MSSWFGSPLPPVLSAAQHQASTGQFNDFAKSTRPVQEAPDDCLALLPNSPSMQGKPVELSALSASFCKAFPVNASCADGYTCTESMMLRSVILLFPVSARSDAVAPCPHPGASRITRFLYT